MLIAGRVSRLEVQWASVTAGIDPFSAEMDLRLSAADQKAHEALVSALGDVAADELDLQRMLRPEAVWLEITVGADLKEAGVPLSTAQVDALAEAHGYSRRPGFYQERAEAVLAPEQLRIFRQYEDDETKEHAWKRSRREGLADPVMGPVFRRIMHREARREYGQAVADLGLDHASQFTPARDEAFVTKTQPFLAPDQQKELLAYFEYLRGLLDRTTVRVLSSKAAEPQAPSAQPFGEARP